MKHLLFLLLFSTTFFVSGQSARKLNNQLKVEFQELNFKYDSLLKVYNIGLIRLKNELSIHQANYFNNSSSFYTEIHNNTKTVNKYNDLNFLKVNLYGVDSNVISTLSKKCIEKKSVEFYDIDFNELMISKKIFKDSMSTDLSVQNIQLDSNIKICNQSIEQLIEKNQKINDLMIKLKKENSILLLSMNKKQNTELVELINNLYLKELQLYQAKGPKGFSKEYSIVFPNAFTPEMISYSKSMLNLTQFQPKTFRLNEIRDVQEMNNVICVDIEQNMLTEIDSIIFFEFVYKNTKREISKVSGDSYKFKFLVNEYGEAKMISFYTESSKCQECIIEMTNLIQKYNKWLPSKLSGQNGFVYNEFMYSF